MNNRARRASQNQSSQAEGHLVKPTTRSQSKLVRSPEEMDRNLQDCSCGCAETIATMRAEIGGLKKRLTELEQVKSSLLVTQRELGETREDAKNSKIKLNMLTNVVIRLEDRVDEVTNKFVSFQARSMRKNIVISGLEEPDRGVETQEMLLDKIHDFFVEKLKVEEIVPMKSYHRFGGPDGSKYRPVVVKLANFEHKAMLLSQGPKLKDLVNNKGKKFFVREQLPEKLNEEKRYYQHWIQENKYKKGPKPEMKIHKNRLRINNELYRKKVIPPTGADILRLDDDELLSIKQCKVIKGGFKLEQGSEFISYAAKVSSAEEVGQAYRKLRIKYADATHISSAYRLHPPNGLFNQEASDDDEHGMGRALLKILMDREATNVAVFLVRYYGGEHIGSKRFDIALKLTETALINAKILQSNSQPTAQSDGTRVKEHAVAHPPPLPSESQFTSRLDLDTLLGVRSTDYTPVQAESKDTNTKDDQWPQLGSGAESWGHIHASANYEYEASTENSPDDTDYDEARSQAEDMVNNDDHQDSEASAA